MDELLSVSNPRLSVLEILLKRQQEIETELRSLEINDPLLAGMADEASDTGADSLEADIHHRLTTTKINLSTLSAQVKKALMRLESGLYGKCEKCGLEIDKERLQALPTALRCRLCA